MPTYRDDFNRANGLLVAPWVTKGTNFLQISTNQLVAGPNAGVAYYNPLIPVVNEQFSELAHIGFTPDGLGQFPLVGPGVRLNSASTITALRGYFAGRGQVSGEESASYVYLWRFDTGPDLNRVRLASSTHGWAANDVVGILASGSQFEVRVNGAIRILASDSTHTDGFVGIVVKAAGVNADWDNWYGGDFLPERPRMSITFNMARTREAGGGLRDFPSPAIHISTAREDWHRTHINALALWSGSSQAVTRQQIASTVWEFETLPDERASFRRDPTTPIIGAGVKVL